MSLPCGQIMKVSSTYLIQQEGLKGYVSMALVSKSSMKMLARAGESGDPIGAPLICLNRQFWKEKYVFDVHCCISESILGEVLCLFLRISKVSDSGILVNNDTTSKLTSKEFGVMLKSFSFCKKWKLFLM